MTDDEDRIWAPRSGSGLRSDLDEPDWMSRPERPPDYQHMLALIDPASWEGQTVPAREWTLDGWLPTKQAAYFGGKGGSGKSLAAQQLCTCMALGLPFLGVSVRQCIAIYITCEDDMDELQRRQADICAALGVSLSTLEGKMHLVSLFGRTGNELATFDGNGRLSTTPRWAELCATVLHAGAGFVALDNVAHFFAGNEIIRNHVAGFCGLLNSLASTAAAAVLLIGHPAKVKDSEYSGSTAWENQFRSRVFLQIPGEDNGVPPDLDARLLTKSKSNYARAGETLAFRWHKWAFIRDEDLPADNRAEIAANIQAAAENQKFLDCLAKATAERRNVSLARSASNYAPKLFAEMLTGKPITKRGFEAALNRLLHLGKIVNGVNVYQRDNRVWVTGLGLAPTLAPTPAPTLHEACTNPGAAT